MSSILDEILGGGTPAGAPPDLPPSIPDPEAAAAGPAAAPPAGPPGMPSEEVAALKDMLGMADGYMALATVTEQERAQMQKVTSVLQTLLASNEKMAEQVSGAQPALRKAYGPGV